MRLIRSTGKRTELPVKVIIKLMQYINRLNPLPSHPPSLQLTRPHTNVSGWLTQRSPTCLGVRLH